MLRSQKKQMAGAAVVTSSMMLVAHAAQDDIGYGPVATMLNKQLSGSENYWDCKFCGGPGVLIRAPDGYEYDPKFVVLPSSFWSNDLFAPSQMYPSGGDPFCPSEYGHDGQPCYKDETTGEILGPWNDVQMAVVIGSRMGNIFPDFDNIQADDWGWGVFYPTDANAVDGRCKWLESDGSFDCPNAWGEDREYNEDFTHGAGSYPFGNPGGGGGGGGAGCHFDNGAQDQIVGDDGSGTSLVQNQHCECNYDLLKGGGWVDHWLTYGGYSGPSSSMDIASCWVSNPRDLITLQNELFWRRNDWNDGSSPWARWDDSPAAQRPYWGWNEVPVDSKAVSDPANWDAVMLKLPAMLGDGTGDRMSMLSWNQGANLEGKMYDYIEARNVVPGSDHITSTPGSSAVIVREWMDGSGNFQREFFCETWASPNGYFRIIFNGDTGDCFFDWGANRLEWEANKLSKAKPKMVSRKPRHNSAHDVSGRNFAVSV